MSNNNNSQFKNISYRLIDEFNEEENNTETYTFNNVDLVNTQDDDTQLELDSVENLIEESLYHSAIESRHFSTNTNKHKPILFNENINENINENVNENISKNVRFSINEKPRYKQQTRSLHNATIYNKPNSENHSNKFVDGSTLNSYLNINDLQQEAKDNVYILKSNISKLDERSRNIQEIESKTDMLLDGAIKFKQKSNYLKNKMFWARIANILLIAFFIFLIVFLSIKLS